MSWVAGAVVAVCGVASPVAVAAEPPTLMVIAERGADAQERAEARADADVVLVERVARRIDVVEVLPGQSVAAAVTELQRDPAVASVEVDRQITVASSDPLFSYQWALDNDGSFLGNQSTAIDADVDAPEAWVTSVGSGATVAIVDTGVDATHPDLAEAVAGGWDFWDNDADAADENGHGTHVAGIVAARAGNGLGVAGLAPASTVLPVRVLDGGGHGLTSTEVAAFTYAAEAGARVVNASFGSETYSPAEDLAIRQHPETLFVVAAGNEGRDLDQGPSYPCALNHQNVLCVGASTVTDDAAEFSNYGSATVDLFAPGDDIASTWLGGSYALNSGTSMAAPHVAATAALILAKYPTMTVSGLRDAILGSVDRPASLAGLSSSGGRLNANGALIGAAELQRPKTMRAPDAPGARPADAQLLNQARPVVPVAPVPGTTAGADTPGRMLFAAITGKPRTRRSTAALVLTLTRPAAIDVVLQRRRCTSGICRWKTEARLVHDGGEGVTRVSLRGRTPRTGRWRAVASSAVGKQRAVEFSVRR